MLSPININGTSLTDVWHQTLYKIIEKGRNFRIDRGSFAGQDRKEFDFITIHANCPGVGELLPKLNPALNLDDPCAQDFLDDYLPYLMTGEEKEGESYCYDKQTKVLTNNGWKLFKDLIETDLMMTLNPANNEMEYQPLIKLHSMHYIGKMHKYQTTQIDCCVTPNHKMFLTNGHSKIKNFKLVKSNEINKSKITFKSNGKWSSEDKLFFELPECVFDSYSKPKRNFFMDDWLAFFGTWLADGSLRKYKNTTKKSYGIVITKYNQPEWLNNILDKVIDKYCYYEKDYVFNNKQIYTYLEQFGLAGDKFIPRELLNLSKRQSQILFDSMYKCDGDKNNKRKYSRYSTKSYALAVGVQELLLRIGLSGNISKDSGIFRVRINMNIKGSMSPCTPSMQLKNRKEINYDDTVYCAEVKKYHTLYVKRNEKPCWSGNTYGQRMCKEKLNTDHTRYINYHTEKILIKDPEIWHDDCEAIKRELVIGKMEYFLNQMELMIWTYKHKGYRNNQMTLQVAKPIDMMLQDPPCLRHIDTRIQDGQLHFFPYFRSWDLWGGMPANLAAIEMMKQYCAAAIGVENGEIIASSKGLHLYSYVFEIAELVRGRSAEEFKKELNAE